MSFIDDVVESVADVVEDVTGIEIPDEVTEVVADVVETAVDVLV